MPKALTEDQARMFHEAMTGNPLCFPDCCLCKATDRVSELELLMREIRNLVKEGDWEGVVELIDGEL